MTPLVESSGRDDSPTLRGTPSDIHAEPPEVAPARTRTIVALAGPAIAGQLLQTGVIYADRVMLGHYSSGALAAMQMAGPLEWTLVAVTSSFSVGTLALVGRAVGAGDREAARRHTTIALFVAAATLSTFGLLFFLLRGTLPALVTDRADLQRVAANAIVVMACAQPFMAAAVVLGQGLRGAGRTRTTMVVSIFTGFVVRLAATWLLTERLHLGVRGVWGGSTADWVVRALLLAWIWRRPRVVT